MNEKVYLSPYHALWLAGELQSYRDELALVAVYAAGFLKVYPYQVAAARFALAARKGAILCDEGSLGKSFEAMLVIGQKWYEGKERILIVVPVSLLQQWRELFDQHFGIPYTVVDSAEAALPENEADGALLTTYDYVAEHAGEIGRMEWDLVVLEEAHYLRHVHEMGHDKLNAIAGAIEQSRCKLLLTATPLQNSIMDLYGLIRLIDAKALPEADEFYQRYFRKPENYPELTELIRPYCFRTRREDVESYLGIPRRLSVAVRYDWTNKERELADLLLGYIRKKRSYAFPAMSRWKLLLKLFQSFSSSSRALLKTLAGVENRLQEISQIEPKAEAEFQLIRRLVELAKGIKVDSKAGALIETLKTCFVELPKLGANRRALIFTENRNTQAYLARLLESNGFKGKVLTYNGDKTRDYDIVRRFREKGQILIATEVAADGLNLEFCSLVIRYDLSYNTLKMEQMITRCHRQGQKNDVISVNFINPHNPGEVRMLELINKRTLQFQGIIGMTDTVGGDFRRSLPEVLREARPREVIEAEQNQAFMFKEDKNREEVRQAQKTIFTGFKSELAEQIIITPEFVRDKTAEINEKLWKLTRYFCRDEHKFTIDETSKTIRYYGGKVFTGARLGRDEYSMAPDYKPASGRHTILGCFALNIIQETIWKGVPDTGTVFISGLDNRARIALYRLKISPKSEPWQSREHFIFAGRDKTGDLDHEACCRLMELPVSSFESKGQVINERNREFQRSSFLDEQLEVEKYLRPVAKAFQPEQPDESKTLRDKLRQLQEEKRRCEEILQKEANRLNKLRAQKRLTAIVKEIGPLEERLYFAAIHRGSEAKELQMVDRSEFNISLDRLFEIKIENCESRRI